MTPPRVSLATVEGIEAFAKFAMDHMRDNFEREGDLMPVVMLAVMRDPRTSEVLTEPGLMVVVCGADFSTSTKESFSEMVREMAKRYQAVAYLFGSESWTVERDIEQHRIEVEQYRDGDLARHPRRKEVLCCILEHVGFDGHRMWMAGIHRHPNGKATVAEFFELPHGEQSGRFADMLPKRGKPSATCKLRSFRWAKIKYMVFDTPVRRGAKANDADCLWCKGTGVWRPTALQARTSGYTLEESPCLRCEGSGVEPVAVCDCGE